MKTFSSLTPYTISLGFLIDEQKYMEGVNSHVSMQSYDVAVQNYLHFSFPLLDALKKNSLRMTVLNKKNELAGNALG
jgi:hypothetical protein